jgi:protein-L-isoaspartate O-methyltransferase
MAEQVTDHRAEHRTGEADGGVAEAALTAQLAPGGTLVAPVGGANAQGLLMLRKDADGNIREQNLAQVVFVPLLSGTVD